MAKKQLKILSVGGSIIIPPGGFNIPFLRKFKKLILDEVRSGTRFILVVGGGATCRLYQEAAKRVDPTLTNVDLDWIGIHTTRFNAQFVRYMFRDQAYKDVVYDPTAGIRTSKPIIVGAGNEPGHSTDMDAVLMAKTYGAHEILNLSNIEYVYDKDPNKYTSARRIEEIDWESFRRDVVGYRWTPGKNAPFDPIASQKAEEMRLRVSILKGTNLPNLKKALQGEKFKGTLIY